MCKLRICADDMQICPLCPTLVSPEVIKSPESQLQQTALYFCLIKTRNCIHRLDLTPA